MRRGVTGFDSISPTSRPSIRVVSLVPSHTETLFALGLDAEVVGVTRFCVHPERARATRAIVGGTKDPDVEKIVALAPDLVVANREENRAADVAALETRGLRCVMFDVARVEDVPGSIRSLARAVGRDGEGLARRVEQAMAATPRAAQVTCYVPIWRAPWMTVGGDTYASSILAATGFANVASGLARYPEMTPESARSRGAESALLPSEPYPFKAKHVEELVAAGFPRDRVKLIDGEALTWYGIRTIEGLAAFLEVRGSLP